MTRADLGWLLFLSVLLLAPGIQFSGLPAKSAVSVAPAALFAWWLLAPMLPMRLILRNPLVLSVIAWACYAFIISASSLEPMSVSYGGQHLVYAVVGGTLMCGYAEACERRNAPDRPMHILACVLACYAALVLVTVWTGPLYTDAGATIDYRYGAFRGIGTADSPNTAGMVMGIGLMLVALTPMYGQIAIATLLALALLATQSRGALIAAAVGIVAVATLTIMAGRGLRPARALLLACLAAGLLVTGVRVLLPNQSIALSRVTEAVYFYQDLDTRSSHWWAGWRLFEDHPPLRQLFGSGLRTSGSTRLGGAHVSAHNGYLELLRDVGLLGTAALLGILLTALGSSTVRWTVDQAAGSLRVVATIIVLTVSALASSHFHAIVALVLLLIVFSVHQSPSPDPPNRARPPHHSRDHQAR